MTPLRRSALGLTAAAALAAGSVYLSRQPSIEVEKPKQHHSIPKSAPLFGEASSSPGLLPGRATDTQPDRAGGELRRNESSGRTEGRTTRGSTRRRPVSPAGVLRTAAVKHFVQFAKLSNSPSPLFRDGFDGIAWYVTWTVSPPVAPPTGPPWVATACRLDPTPHWRWGRRSTGYWWRATPRRPGPWRVRVLLTGRAGMPARWPQYDLAAEAAPWVSWYVNPGETAELEVTGPGESPWIVNVAQICAQWGS